MSATVTLDELRAIDLFDGLSDVELEQWRAVALPYEVAPGELIVEEGAPRQGVQLLFTGTARAMQVGAGGTLLPVARQRAPTWMGAVATLTGGSASVRMVADTDCRVATVNADDFKRLAAEQPIIAERVMQIVAPVVSRMVEMEQSREHLAALGTMAAGLAHELNNPAAAAARSASQLIDALKTVDGAMHTFVSAGVERAEAEALIALQGEATQRAAGQTALSALDASDAEDELQDALEDAGVPDAWSLAEPLAAAGVDADWLGRVEQAAGTVLPDALRWIAATLTARGLADELQESTRRMTDLVGAVKRYAYMDRGDVQMVDLHDGLETTVRVLGHKLREANVTVVRDYDRTLPPLLARGPALNQVWTNLVDNAVDALEPQGGGTINLSTSRDAGCALIRVTDDGPGIDPEHTGRIFETFFTTKEVGRGTGLGLATAHRIVVDAHDGSLTVDSEPGRTTFNVWLPYRHAGDGPEHASGNDAPATSSTEPGDDPETTTP